MSHVRIDSDEFARLITYLRQAEAEARSYADNRQYPSAAGHLLGCIGVQLINLETIQEFHTHSDATDERPVFKYARDVATPEVDLVGEVNENLVLN